MVLDAELLTVGSDRLRIGVLPLGATLAAVWAPDATGAVANVVLQLPEPADYGDPATNPYLGSTVGRYANRIGDGRFAIDGIEHAVVANEGSTCLHGGPTGWAHRRWDVVAHDLGAVVLRIVSPDGEGGFPGAVEAIVTYRVDDDVLWFEADATTTKATPLSITNHAYWNLAGGGTATTADIGGHRLRLPSTRVVEVDDRLIPTGATPPPAGDLDLSDGAPLGARRIDHAYWPEVPARAVLSDPASGRTVELRTDQPSIQVYTGDHLGRPWGSRGGVCLEPQQLPDAPNQPSFPTAIVRPPQRYRHRTSYRFGVAGAPQGGSGTDER